MGSEQVLDILGNIGIGLLILFFPVGLYVAWRKRRTEKHAYHAQDDSSFPVEGTEEERMASENMQAEWSNNLRAQLARDHEIIGRLNTIDGYSLPYVQDLLMELRNAGIQAEYHFQETSPIGVGASMIERHGDYEIFVDKTRTEEAVEIVNKFRST